MMKTALFRIMAVLCIFSIGCAVRYFGEPLSVYEREYEPLRDTLNVHLNAGRAANEKGFFPIDFQYSLIAAMSDSLGVAMPIVGSRPDSGCWDRLAAGETDIVVKRVGDTVGAQYAGRFLGSAPYMDFEMVVRNGDRPLLDAVNRWLRYAELSKVIGKMQSLYFRSYDLTSCQDSGRKAYNISPYDEIIRLYSRTLGWDWRLLSAVVYHESRFFMESVSRRGAVGLMQVMKSTAAAYGVEDLYDPAENIKAGTAYLAYLKKRYESKGMDSANVVKFTLAAYNAGENRIQDCINFTNSLGRNFHDWEEVAEVIPLMREPEYYQDANFLRYGKFIGKETILYVEKVLERYDLYVELVH